MLFTDTVLSRSTLIVADILVIGTTWFNHSVRQAALSYPANAERRSLSRILFIDGERANYFTIWILIKRN